jgi:hypothetical protein
VLIAQGWVKVDDRFDRHRLTMHLRRNSFMSRAGEHP